MENSHDLVGILWTVVLAVLAVALPAGASAAACRRLWWDRPHLAPAFAFLGVGVSGLAVFFAAVSGPELGVACAWAVLTASAVVLGVAVLRGRRSPLLAAVRAGAPLALVTGGLVSGTIGLFLLWGGTTDLFALARIRFSHPLPVDNALPAMFVERLLGGEDPRTPVSGWLSSDRPPLQVGLLLLARTLTGWAGVPTTVQDFGASLVVQATWVPAAWSLIRALRFSRRAAAFALLLTGASGTVLVNTVFSWPKLLSAAFVLAACAIAVDLRERRQHRPVGLTVIAVLAACGLLSHGASIFALPVLAVLLWPARRGTSPWHWLAAAAAAAATYAPWLAYQRWYDPPGDRLLKMHLAGVLEPNDNSFLADLLQAYGRLSFGELVEHKIQNLALPFSLQPLGLPAAETLTAQVRESQFFTVVGAVGLAVLPLVAMTWTAAAARRAHRAPGPEGAATGVLAAALAGVVLWGLVMFGPATTYVHQGSHVPVVLASTLPTAWLADRRPRLAALLLAGQLALLVGVYGPGPSEGQLRSAAVLTLCAGLVACAAGLLLSRPTTNQPISGTTTVIGRDGEAGRRAGAGAATQDLALTAPPAPPAGPRPAGPGPERVR